MTNKKSDSLDPNYFVATDRRITLLFLVCLFYLLPAALMKPSLLPPLGPLTTLYISLIQRFSTYAWFIFTCSIYLHLAEVLISIALCMRYQLNVKTTIKWALSVFVNGIFSLFFLVTPTYSQ